VSAAIRARACGLRMLLLDVDGVLTDGRLTFSNEASASASASPRLGAIKAFHVRDGVGVRLLQEVGIEVGILSGRRSSALRQRARELGIELLREGCHDKLRVFETLLIERGITAAEVAYMGDDLPDLPVLAEVGLSAAPRDACAEIRARVDLVTQAAGGQGAVRELADYIVALRRSSGAATVAAVKPRGIEVFLCALGTIHDAIAGFIEEGAEASEIAAALELVAARPRLIVVGLGKSGHVARSLAALFTATGTPAHFLHACEALHGDLGIAVDRPAALLLSKSGRTEEIVRLTAELQRRGCPCVCITCDPSSPLAAQAEVVINLGARAEADRGNLVPTASVTLMQAVGGALAVALMERRGVATGTFRANHPGGHIGANLHEG